MIEFTQLQETAHKLASRLESGGLAALDQVLNASIRTAATYRYTYDRFLEYFEGTRARPLNEQDLFVGFAMAYSWMATIKQMDPTIDTVGAATRALNRLRGFKAADIAVEAPEEGNIAPEGVLRLRQSIEPVRQFLGSVVGTSRLLHFVNPEVFPMWDAIIHRYCDQGAKRKASDSLSRYIQYAASVHRLVAHADFESNVHAPVTAALERANQAVNAQYRMPGEMGRIRTAEFVMFYGGKAEHLAEQEERRAGPV